MLKNVPIFICEKILVNFSGYVLIRLTNIYGITYMELHIWNYIYGITYMELHIWNYIYGITFGT